MPTATDDPILRRFRAALDQLCGDRIERLVRFASRPQRRPPGLRLDIPVFIEDPALL